ncbi:MAG: fumarylacetoacetate hydrolase family protein [Aeriscardovia sp.]|nr:fumarylacetoacetate hydrolase family protein [Aeriscardovia sp.]
MRVARFTKDEDLPEYGFVQEDKGKKIVAALSGNPFAGDATLSGQRFDLSEVRLLAPNFPLKIFCCDDFKDFYLKPATCAVGPDDILSIPDWSQGVEIRAGIGIIIATSTRNCAVSDVENHILGITCVLDSTALSDRSQLCNTAFDDSLALGPWIETKIDPDSRLIFGHERPEEIRGLLKCALKNISFISTFSTLLPGDMVVARSPFSRKVDLPDEARVKIEGLGYLRSYVRKEDSKA